MIIDLTEHRSQLRDYHVTCADIVKPKISHYYYTSSMHHTLASLKIANWSQYHNVTESLVVICILTCITTVCTALKCYFILFT